MKGKVSKTGYKKNSPDVDNDFNVIPSGQLTMQGVNFPVMGIDNFGNRKLMMPGVNSYKFPGSQVTEFPIRQMGGDTGGLSPEDARTALIQGHLMGQQLSDAQRIRFAEIAGTDEDGNFLNEEGEIVEEGYHQMEDGSMMADEDMRRGGQLNHKRYTSKNIKSSMNELFLRNYNAYGKSGRHVFNPNAKQFGGDIVEGDYENNFDNPFFQMGGTPTNFKTQQEFDAWQKSQGRALYPGSKGVWFNPKDYSATPDLSRESGYKWTALTPTANVDAFNRPAETFSFTPPTPQIKQTARTGYIPFGQDTTGPKGYTKAGDTSGQTYQFINGEYQPTPAKLSAVSATFKGGGEFLKALIKNAHKDVMKAGGENKSSSPQGVTQDEFLNNRNNTFKNFLSNTTLYAMAMEESQDLESLHKEALAKCGGAYMQQGGTFQPAENSDAYWNTLSGYDDGVQNQVDVDSGITDMSPETMEMRGIGSSNYTQQPLVDATFQGPQQIEAIEKKQVGFNGQLIAEGVIGGMNFLTAGLNSRNTLANENLLKQRMNADNIFSVNQAGSADRGQYEVNSGVFQPNKYVPIQQRGNMKQGGSTGEEQFLSEKEIRRLQKLGYTINYLD